MNDYDCHGYSKAILSFLGRAFDNISGWIMLQVCPSLYVNMYTVKYNFSFFLQ